jgi:methylated-DNA-[protein]-cysteine S-methyltransferase
MERTIESPVGRLRLAASDHAVTGIWLRARSAVTPGRATGLVAELERQLAEYFAGRRQRFDVPLAPEGTAFQQDVWRALIDIPYGETCSYGQLAAKIGRPDAVRAVGAANGQNPIPIVIPCHRVIGANGTLTGFGGGLPMKRRLLDLERGQFALWRD